MPLDKLFSGLSDTKTDPRALLEGFLKAPGAQGALGGAASGALVSLLMNSKARKKLQKHAINIGGMAAVAGIGYYAYQKWQKNRTASPSAASPDTLPASKIEDSIPTAEPPPVPPELPMKMVLAMIAAAAADGNIDREEMAALAKAIDDAPVTPEEKTKLTAALNQPPPVEAIAALASNPEEACEIYGAALTTIELDTPSEHLFLRRLSSALKLDDALVNTLHQTLEKA